MIALFVSIRRKACDGKEAAAEFAASATAMPAATSALSVRPPWAGCVLEQAGAGIRYSKLEPLIEPVGSATARARICKYESD